MGDRSCAWRPCGRSREDASVSARIAESGPSFLHRNAHLRRSGCHPPRARRRATLHRSVSDDESVWALPAGLPNAAGTLALHLAGNLQHYVGKVLGGSPTCATGRQSSRGAAFPAPSSSPRSMPRARRWRVRCRRCRQARSRSRIPSRSAARCWRRQETFLVHLAAHLAYHLGQIDYHRRVVTGNAQGVGALSPAAPAPSVRTRLASGIRPAPSRRDAVTSTSRCASASRLTSSPSRRAASISVVSGARSLASACRRSRSSRMPSSAATLSARCVDAVSRRAAAPRRRRSGRRERGDARPARRALQRREPRAPRPSPAARRAARGRPSASAAKSSDAATPSAASVARNAPRADARERSGAPSFFASHSPARLFQRRSRIPVCHHSRMLGGNELHVECVAHRAEQHRGEERAEDPRDARCGSRESCR